MEHAKEMYPHLDCMDDLIKISDMTLPANWYPEARAITRKVIFHAGPTNSGKTYHALKRLKEAKSGIYCGPLRMLANEVFQKLNAEVMGWFLESDVFLNQRNILYFKNTQFFIKAADIIL